MSEEPQIPAENVATLDDNTILVLLMPDETLNDAFAFMRHKMESGFDVIAATPTQVERILKALKDDG